jgi:putative peptidoglycan lipid II flippase
MVSNIFIKGKKIFTAPQESILSAALVIMLLVIVSQIFGLLRQWVLLRLLGQHGYALYLAGFRLPDLVFEVFVFGAFSSAFIPVFTRHLKKGDAWELAGRLINIVFILFAIVAFVFSLFAYQFYSLVTPGFSDPQVAVVAQVSRILFLAQGFFIISYVVTGVLESLRRFLVPALAPIFYNLGIILGAIFLFDKIGIYAPAVGAVLGAFTHLAIQLPLAYKLGFRFSKHVKPNEGVKEVGKLAAPRFLELIFLQGLKTAELFFSSLISLASYTFLNLAYSLYIVPVTLFGVSMAKAAMVTLSRQDDPKDFKRTVTNTLNQMMFFIIPAAAFIIVLRIPIVRLFFGTSQSLDWAATVQTGWVLSAFAISIPFQAAVALFSRAFYALHDTKTPVILSISDVVFTLVLELIFVLVMRLPVWSIAAANTIAMVLQTLLLLILLGRKLKLGGFPILPILKISVAAILSSSLVFFLLKLFDRSVWIKRLSFLSTENAQSVFTSFQSFVLDTRYTFNLLALTLIVAVIGGLVYLGICWLLGSQELYTFASVVKNRAFKRPPKEAEIVTSTEEDM